ncbi:MAG: rhodanese-like domain-containing protein [Flavobacteriaceae bacterium]|nr:rhodanese-like domain-containing protein [Flavobacteriaceae bacterium]
MGIFDMFSSGPSASDIQAYLDKGAVVVDVRTPGEYAEGHVKGSKNIVLDTIADNLETIKGFNAPIITVCRSGARSGSAQSFLANQGIDVINGGPWNNVAPHVK